MILSWLPGGSPDPEELPATNRTGHIPWSESPGLGSHIGLDYDALARSGANSSAIVQPMPEFAPVSRAVHPSSLGIAARRTAAFTKHCHVPLG